jgi:hypothetical protein
MGTTASARATLYGNRDTIFSGASGNWLTGTNRRERRPVSSLGRSSSRHRVATPEASNVHSRFFPTPNPEQYLQKSEKKKRKKKKEKKGVQSFGRAVASAETVGGGLGELPEMGGTASRGGQHQALASVQMQQRRGPGIASTQPIGTRGKKQKKTKRKNKKRKQKELPEEVGVGDVPDADSAAITAGEE